MSAHGTSMHRLWATVKAAEGITFTKLTDAGFHSNLITRALTDGVLLHAKKTLPCVGCGRPSRLLLAAKNPVVMTFPSIQQANAAKLIALDGVYVKATGTGFNVYPHSVGRSLFVSAESTVSEVVTWAARQQ